VLLLDLGLPAAKQHLRFSGGHLLPAGYVDLTSATLLEPAPTLHR
jgi:hypothetical protein